jgi:hypothetical protein
MTDYEIFAQDIATALGDNFVVAQYKDRFRITLLGEAFTLARLKQKGDSIVLEASPLVRGYPCIDGREVKILTNPSVKDASIFIDKLKQIWTI